MKKTVFMGALALIGEVAMFISSIVIMADYSIGEWECRYGDVGYEFVLKEYGHCATRLFPSLAVIACVTIAITVIVTLQRKRRG